MWKGIVLSVLWVAVHGVVLGQRISPLFEIIPAGSLIDRPPEFRAMQEEIAKKFADVPSGLRIDYLRDLLKNTRDKLLGMLKNVQVKVDITTDELHVDPVQGMSPIKWPVQSLSGQNPIVALEQLRFDVKNLLSNFIQKSLGPIRNNDIEDGVAFGLLEAMHSQGVAPNHTIASFKSYKERLAEELSWILFERLEERIGTSVPGFNMFIDTWPSDLATKKDIQKLIEEATQALVSDVNGRLVDAFNSAEDAMNALTEKVPFLQPSGTTGLAVSKGGGDVNGGIHISLHVGELMGGDLQGGLYLNGQFDPPDSAQPGPILAGGQIRMTWGNLQIDGLYSVTFADSSNLAQRTTSYESGGSISYNFGGAIIGVAAFYQSGKVTVWTLDTNASATPTIHDLSKLSTGIQFRLPAAQAPSFTIGWSWQSGGSFRDGFPIFQLGVPITGKQ